MSVNVRRRLFWAIIKGLKSGKVLKIRHFSSIQERNTWVNEQPESREVIKTNSPLIKKVHRKYQGQEIPMEITEL